MSKLPYMPYFVDDFDAATAHLTFEEDGVYNRLLRICWRSPGCSVPDDKEWIRRKMRASEEQYEKLIEPIIGEFFTRKRNRVFQKRQKIEFDRSNHISKARSEAGKKGGKSKSLKNNKNSGNKNSSLPKEKEDQNAGKNVLSTPTPTLTSKEEEKKAAPPGKFFEVDPDSEFAAEYALYHDFLVKLECENNFNMIGKFGIFKSWLDFGCDYHLDIIETSIAVANRQKSKGEAISIGYLTPAVKSAHDSRIRTGKSEAKYEAVKPASPEQWCRRITKFSADNEHWTSAWGPNPDDPGCLAPHEILEKYTERRRTA